jgi:hypothetical protein
MTDACFDKVDALYEDLEEEKFEVYEFHRNYTTVCDIGPIMNAIQNATFNKAVVTTKQKPFLLFFFSLFSSFSLYDTLKTERHGGFPTKVTKLSR